MIATEIGNVTDTNLLEAVSAVREFYLPRIGTAGAEIIRDAFSIAEESPGTCRLNVETLIDFVHDCLEAISARCRDALPAGDVGDYSINGPKESKHLYADVKIDDDHETAWCQGVYEDGNLGILLIESLAAESQEGEDLEDCLERIGDQIMYHLLCGERPGWLERRNEQRVVIKLGDLGITSILLRDPDTDKRLALDEWVAALKERMDD